MADTNYTIINGNGTRTIRHEEVDVKNEILEYSDDFDNNWGNEFEDEAVENYPTLNGHEKLENSDSGISVSQIKLEPECFIQVKEEYSDEENKEDEYLDEENMYEGVENEEEETEEIEANSKKRKISNSFSSIFGLPSQNGHSLEKPAIKMVISEDKHRKRPKALYNYTTAMLQEALDLVRSQNISILNAAKQYGIPRSTLRRYALTSWEANTHSSKSKIEPSLTQEEEQHLVKIITKMSRAGKYVSTMDVKSTVQHLLDASKRMVFKDRNRPNAGWVQRFRKRHRDLQIKGSGYTLKRSGNLTKLDVHEWYKEVTNYLQKDWNINADEFFTDKNSHRIFNIDEMLLLINHRSALLQCKVKNTEEDYTTEITVLSAVSASGDVLQPLIIQKGEGGGHEDDIMPLDQCSYGISFSIAGKMNSDIFLRWLEAFDREICEKGVQKPIVIFLDDLFSHFHISVFTYAIQNDIILLCVQSQEGIVLQPVDAQIINDVRVAYKNFCIEFYQTENMPVSIDYFPMTISRAFEEVRDKEDLKERIKKSFSYMGLLPFDRNAKIYSYVSAHEGLPMAIPPEQDTLKVEKLLNSKQIVVKNLDFRNRISSNSFHTKALTNKALYNGSQYKVLDQQTASGPSSKPSLNFSKSSLPKPEISLDRIQGRLDGAKNCLDLMQSFIPNDLLTLWSNRGDNIKTSPEISYCMWKTVRSILKDLQTKTDKQISRSKNSCKS